MRLHNYAKLVWRSLQSVEFDRAASEWKRLHKAEFNFDIGLLKFRRLDQTWLHKAGSSS